MITTNERLELPRHNRDEKGRILVSVTSAMALVKTVLLEDADSYGLPALAKIHQLEGTGAHSATLDFLAHKHGWLPSYQPPAWPESHGDERRWNNVMHAAVAGFMEFVDRYAVEPVAIEQTATSNALGLIGHIDLLANLTWRKRRVLALIDLKFVTAIQESHRLQLRCYSRLDQIKGCNVGILYHANRNTGHWKLEEVDLHKGLEDVAAVANAARLWAWAEGKKH